jgi:predicted MFS family arabinose efflux permease
MLATLFLYAVTALAAVLSTRQAVAMALLFVAAWSLVTAFSTLNSLVQENAPDALRGRVLSIYGLAFRGGMPLGSLIAGPLVRTLGAPAVLGSFSGLLALVSVAVYIRNGRLRAL